MEINKIYLGDCRNLLNELSDDSIDIIITSPPYNINDDKYQDYNDNLSKENYFNFLCEVIDNLKRVTKYYVFFNMGFLNSTKEIICRLMGKYASSIKEIIIWNKSGGGLTSSDSGCLSNDFELVLIFSKYDSISRSFKRSFFNSGSNVINIKRNIEGNNKYALFHNATFPEDFVRYFIKNFTQEEDLILDPFMGTGTTASVCKQNNRNFIGFEINKKYIDISNERLKQNILSEVKNE